MAPRLTAAEVKGVFEKISNWGRWGKDDQRGALNFITPQKRAAAARLAQTGEIVSLAQPLSTQTALDNPQPVQHMMLHAGSPAPASLDFFAIASHGMAFTHLAALCHVFWQGKMYNGFSSSEIGRWGAGKCAIDVARDGVISRGVLLDIPKLKKVDFLELREPIYPEDLDAAEKAEGVHVEEGDVYALGLFGGVEILGVDRLAQFKEIDLFQLRDIEQNAAADDAVARNVDRTFARTPSPDLAAAEAVVHLALPEDVAEGGEMREGHPVRSNREEVERSGRRRSGMQHHMLHGLRIIERGLGRERLRKRDYLAGLGEARRRGAFLRCDEVERPALVILAPASPVADLLEDAFDFGRGQAWCHVTFSRDACPQCIFSA